MITERFDVQYQARDADVLASLEIYGLTGRLIEREGPAGGNPLWEVRGPFAAMQRWCTDHYGPELDPTSVVFA